MKNTVRIQISVYHEKPSITEQRVRPEKHLKDRFWVPQTLFDCVWVYYMFYNEEQALEYFNKINENIGLEENIHNIKLLDKSEFPSR